MAIEEEFAIEIPDAEADNIKSVGDAIGFISSHPMAKVSSAVTGAVANRSSVSSFVEVLAGFLHLLSRWLSMVRSDSEGMSACGRSGSP
eukprot:scaffold3323_cov279-Pinguiococcus_pyrenoidosus.AAC.10